MSRRGCLPFFGLFRYDPSASPSIGDVHGRHLIELEMGGIPKGKCIRLVTYNLLAPMYRPRHTYVRDLSLAWSSRRNILLREILSYNADILCLQEVQSTHFRDFWAPELEKAGYKHIYKQKDDKMVVGEQNVGVPDIDGCVLLYKSSRLYLMKSYEANFIDLGKSLIERSAMPKESSIHLLKDNVAIVAILRLGDNTSFCVATTHIAAAVHRMDVKLLQITELVRGLTKLHEAGFPIILCGDFNVTPTDLPYKYLIGGHVDHLDDAHDPAKFCPNLMLNHQLHLSSAYSSLFTCDVERASLETRLMDPATHEPLFTTKVPAYMGNPKFVGTTDYIFYQARHISVRSLLELVELAEEEYLPSDIFPSDHIALLADLDLNIRPSVGPLSLPDNLWG